VINNGVYEFYFASCMNVIFNVMPTSELNMMFTIYNIIQHSDWLRSRLMDQSQQILLGHAIS